MKKLILTVIPFLAINLMATEIKLDGKYAYALGNPFKEKLEHKTKAITLKSTDSTLLKLDVKSNINTNNLLVRPTYFSIKQNECQNILRKYLAEDFFIKEDAKTTVSCKFLPSTVILDYHEDHMTYILRDVDMDVNLLLKAEREGKAIFSKELNMKVNKDLGIKGDEYDWSIRYTFDFEHEPLEETVQKILEYSVFKLVSSELEDKKGSF